MLTTTGHGPLDRLLGAFKRADIEATKRELHADFELIEPQGLPYAGTYSGHAGWELLLKRLQETYSELVADPWEVTANAAGDRLMVLYHLKVKLRGSGKAVETELAELVCMREDRISKIIPYYFSTAVITDAM